MEIRLTCKNRNLKDCGKTYVFSRILDYALSEKEEFDQIASEDLGKEVSLKENEICNAINYAVQYDLSDGYRSESLFEEGGTLSNDWKNQEVIDFDDFNLDKPDYAQSLYNALIEGWKFVASRK